MTDIYFRTDGNSEIATGHLVRCLAIARACVQKGANITFIVSDEESLVLLQERFTHPQEFPVCCLHRSYQDLEQEIPTLLSCLPVGTGPDEPASVNKGGRPWIFIDSYFATTAYFKTLQKYFRTAYLDDLRTLDCTVDLVINYDTAEDCACYAHAARKLLGIQYTPLREQFCTPSYEVRPHVSHVLLSTGGTDPYRVAESLLHKIYDHTLPADTSIEKFADNSAKSCIPPAQNSLSATDIMAALRSLHYHVLTSRANSRYSALITLAGSNPQIHIHTNVTDVAALMASCDLAVSAGGTTLCELCAVGVPAISYLMADNQRTAVDAYAKKNLIPCAGDIRPVNALEPMIGDAVIHNILAFLRHMAQNYPARCSISSAMRNHLDGTGSYQIAQALFPC